MSVNKVNQSTGELSPIAGGTLYADAPVGSIQAYGGATAPFGWLLCQGQAVSRATYAELFGVIGTSFGAGDGSTTFNVPDLRSQTPVGVDSRDTNINAIGKTYGEKTHTLTVAEIPSHAHGLNNHTHSIPALSGTAASAGSHTHTSKTYLVNTTAADGAHYSPVSSGYNVSAKDLSAVMNAAGAHTHSVTTTASTTGAASGNTATNGSGNSHNIMQPSTAVNYIIKAKQVALPSDFETVVDEKIAKDGVYSTTETKTNKTWIDGKPIYRKVIDCGSLPNATTAYVAHGITGVDKYISVTGIAQNTSGEAVQLPYGGPTPVNAIAIHVNGTNIQITDGTDYSAWTAFAILEYTKTTD